MFRRGGEGNAFCNNKKNTNINISIQNKKCQNYFCRGVFFRHSGQSSYISIPPGPSPAQGLHPVALGATTLLITASPAAAFGTVVMYFANYDHAGVRQRDYSRCASPIYFISFPREGGFLFEFAELVSSKFSFWRVSPKRAGPTVIPGDPDRFAPTQADSRRLRPSHADSYASSAHWCLIKSRGNVV